MAKRPVFIVPGLNPPLVCVWECGGLVVEFKNARSFSRKGSKWPLVRRLVSARTWNAFLRGHSWRHLWHRGAAAASEFQLRSLCPGAEGRATGSTSLVAWPLVSLLRPPEGSGKVPAPDLGPPGGKASWQGSDWLCSRGPSPVYLVCNPCGNFRLGAWRDILGSWGKSTEFGVT